MATPQYPLITVILNTHPAAHALLGRAVESVLAQTYQDYEFIIVCDGEPGKEMAEVIARYNDDFEKLAILGTFLATEEVFGSQAGPKNWATYHAKGAYIAYLDGDNAWHPAHLQRLLDAMRESEVWPDFTYGRRRYVRDEGAPEKVGDTPLLEGESGFQPWGADAIDRLKSHPMNNFIDTSDFLVSKGALYNKIHRTGWAWNEKHRRFGDWILMVEGVCFAGWRGRGVDEVLTDYHWHSENISHSRPAHEGVGMDQHL
jgi:glycosyltransferase involved in cell wall biosynthesis